VPKSLKSLGVRSFLCTTESYFKLLEPTVTEMASGPIKQQADRRPHGRFAGAFLVKPSNCES
jgi:hypothetical protein